MSALFAEFADRVTWIDDIPYLDVTPSEAAEADAAMPEFAVSPEDVARFLVESECREIHEDLVEAGLAMPEPEACPSGHWAITMAWEEFPENMLS